MDYSMFTLESVIRMQHNQLAQENALNAVWMHITGAMDFANAMIMDEGMDEERVLIKLVSMVDSIAGDIENSYKCLILYPAFTDYLKGKRYKIGHFMCSFIPQTDDSCTECVFLKIEQDDSYALIFPEIAEKNPSKIIRDGKLVTGRYRFNNQTDNN